MPRPVLVTTLALVALAAVLGLWLGQGRLPMDETRAINMVAERYTQETGGQATDCVARPGAGAVWLRVTCGARVYELDARGSIIPEQGPQT